MNLRTCAPSEDSDQPAQLRSLIRIFTGRILGCNVSYEDSHQTAWMRRLIWVYVRRTCSHVEAHIMIRYMGKESVCHMRTAKAKVSPSLLRSRQGLLSPLTYFTEYIVDFVSRSARVAVWLALPTSHHEVLSSNPAGGEIQLMTAFRYWAFHYHPYIISIGLK